MTAAATRWSAPASMPPRSLSSPSRPSTPSCGRGASAAGPAPGRRCAGQGVGAELQELVRRRAAEDRAVNRKASTVPEGTASLPLRHLVRMERAPVRSNKPGGAFVKRSISKLLGWQFDNVIASVNRLHQATIDAVELLEAQRTETSDSNASAAASKDRSRA